MVAQLKVKTKFDPAKIRAAVKRGNIDSLGRAGALVRTVARRSLRRRGVKKLPSRPGQPPKTTGPLKRSILFEVEKDKSAVVIGPSSDIVDDVGTAHEFGGQFRGVQFPKRPFMGPALIKVTPQLPRLWAKSVR